MNSNRVSKDKIFDISKRRDKRKKYLKSKKKNFNDLKLLRQRV